MTFRPKKLPLSKKLKFSEITAEKQTNLDQLKRQDELGKTAEKEAFYQEAHDNKCGLQDGQPFTLPTSQHDVTGASFNGNDHHARYSIAGLPEKDLFRRMYK